MFVIQNMPIQFKKINQSVNYGGDNWAKIRKSTEIILKCNSTFTEKLKKIPTEWFIYIAKFFTNFVEDYYQVRKSYFTVSFPDWFLNWWVSFHYNHMDTSHCYSAILLKLVIKSQEEEIKFLGAFRTKDLQDAILHYIFWQC